MTSKPSYMVIVLEIYADNGAYRFRFAAAHGCDSCGLRSEKFFEFPAPIRLLRKAKRYQLLDLGRRRCGAATLSLALLYYHAALFSLPFRNRTPNEAPASFGKGRILPTVNLAAQVLPNDHTVKFRRKRGVGSPVPRLVGAQSPARRRVNPTHPMVSVVAAVISPSCFSL